MADSADPRVVEQALRKGELEITKLRAEAQAAELGLLPTLPESIPTGSLDAGDAGSPIGVAAAYRALETVAAHIAATVPEAATSVWIAPGDAVTRAKAVFEAVDAALGRVASELEAARQLLAPPQQGLLPTAALAALTLGTSMIGPIASLLATDTKIRAADVTIPFAAVAAPVAQALIAQGRRVIVSGAPAPVGTALIERLRDVEGLRDDLARDLASYRAAHVENPSAHLLAAEEHLEGVKLLVAECVKDKDAGKAQLDLLKEAAGHVASARADIAEASAMATQVATVVADATSVLAALSTAPSGGDSAIHLASVYEAAKEAHALVLVPAYAGAESIYEDVKMRKDRGLHVGTVVVSFVLTDPAGTVVAAGNVVESRAAKTTVGETGIDWGPGHEHRPG